MMNPPERHELRISDAERDNVASILRDAAGDGRLDLEELDERLTAVYAAKTYGDLEPITRDLPSASSAPATPAVPLRDRIGGVPSSSLGIGILGGFERKGTWVMPETFNAVAFWGGGELDLREARFAGPQVTINAWAVMGGIEIIVPEDADVRVNGIGIMGGFDHRATGIGSSDAPRIIVNGLAFWGGVSVERKPSDAELKRRKEERKREKLERRRRRQLE
ncbi:hypothetical protein GCM10027176_17430 [Actinoallomurus bryophytorum]|uniref:Uncharacterized protein DUF1707 n=1 Tax=Actinoallomurus bryophytorum TaxID=1490222 RepID=A0A543CLK1_9ACTN|nr:DUF1707 domain-containing protein [Actinoallomurus bryophytorum]TQL97965.1 uncharacterized protein DUF1707 [Actinoallomurus bryophytorum]